MVLIGQSAAKPRTEEGSTTILYGVVKQAYGFHEAVDTTKRGEDIVWSYAKAYAGVASGFTFHYIKR